MATRRVLGVRIQNRLRRSFLRVLRIDTRIRVARRERVKKRFREIRLANSMICDEKFDIIL